MANTTRIKADLPATGRVLTVFPFKSSREVDYDVPHVYLAIEDSEGNLLGNVNVSLDQLIEALTTD